MPNKKNYLDVIIVIAMFALCFVAMYNLHHNSLDADKQKELEQRIVALEQKSN